MSEQLAITQTPHNPDSPQEPLPPIDANVFDAEVVAEESVARGPHEPVVARYLGLADPSKNEAGPRISIPAADVTEVPVTNSDSQPYVRQPARQNRQSGAYGTGSSHTYRAQSSQHGAWNLLNATLHTPTPDSRKPFTPTEPTAPEAPKGTAETKREAKIDTPEQLRSAYQNRINAIVSSRVDLKGLGYDENTPLAQLRYLTILAANAMLERGFYIVPAAEQLRRAFKTDKDHYASLSAASFETLAKAEVTQQEDDAACHELYAVASGYYDAKTLQSNKYQWATRAELQEIIEAAKSSEVPPKLVDVRTKRWLGAKAVSLGAVFVPQFNRTQAVV